MSVTHTHQTAIADDGSDVGANVWNADHTIAAPLTVPGTANTSSLVGTGYSLTGSNAQPMESWAGTLNTSGVVDVIKIAITDTAHGGGSNLFNLLGGASGTTSLFSISTSGNVTASGGFITPSSSSIVSGRNLIFGDGFNVLSNTRGGFSAPSDGIFTWFNNAGTNFNKFQLGGTTASFPAIKRNGTAVNIRLADDSADAPITASTVATIPTTVSNLPAAATAGGARAFVTDATQTMTAGIGAAVVGGGANKVPVYCDGTGWFIG
jgi:hypothetical protein